MNRLDEIRAHDKGLNLSHSDLYNAYYQARKDRSYLLDLLDRVVAWIEATKYVESIAKHGRLKAEHYKDAADELTAILNEEERQ